MQCGVADWALNSTSLAFTEESPLLPKEDANFLPPQFWQTDDPVAISVEHAEHFRVIAMDRD